MGKQRMEPDPEISDREPTRLRAAVDLMLDTHPGFGFRVVQHERSASFGNEEIVIQSERLRLRFVRDRGTVFVDFGSNSEPQAWFDSDVVIAFLELSREGGFHSRDPSEVVNGITSLLQSCSKELYGFFSEANFATSKRRLEALRDARAAKLFRLDNT